MKFTTGTLMPLDQTSKEWFTEEYLASYFEVARDELLNFGAAIVNPDFEPDVPYSQEIHITRPELIYSHDETRLELECTRSLLKGRGR